MSNKMFAFQIASRRSLNDYKLIKHEPMMKIIKIIFKKQYYIKFFFRFVSSFTMIIAKISYN